MQLYPYLVHWAELERKEKIKASNYEEYKRMKNGKWNFFDDFKDNRSNFIKNQRVNQILKNKQEGGQPSTSQNNNFFGVGLNDIKSAFKPFTGDHRSNIYDWISRFEEQCGMFQLPSIQKYILAKRMITEEAKLLSKMKVHPPHG